jgi:DNA invertase Pin-like site-specific DNA recombinase
MRTGLYARVSTVDKNQDPELQLERLRDYARAHNWEIAEEYIDYASGAKWNRPAFQKIMEDARKRRIDAILVVRLDRFSRSVIDLENSLQEMKRHGVDFICTEQPIDTSTPQGNLIFHILGAIAEFERELIRMRVTEGMQKAKRDGKRIGRRRIEIGQDVLLKAIQEGKGTIRGTRVGLEKRGIHVSVGTVHRMLKGLVQKPPSSSDATAMENPSNSVSSVH